MRQPQHARRLGARGVTLIELLVVVGIIGIVAAFTIPRIDVQGIRVNGAIQSVGTTMLAAQRLAVTRQHDVIVMFDQANAALRVHEDANNNGTVDAGERVRPYPMGDLVVFGLGGAPPRAIGAGPITFTQTRGGFTAVTFHRNGSASEFGGFYMTSRRATLAAGRSKDTRALEIERSTGRSSWYRYTGAAWEQGF